MIAAAAAAAVLMGCWATEVAEGCSDGRIIIFCFNFNRIFGGAGGELLLASHVTPKFPSSVTVINTIILTYYAMECDEV